MAIAHENEFVCQGHIGPAFENNAVEAEVFLEWRQAVIGQAFLRDIFLPEGVSAAIGFSERSVVEDFASHHVERTGVPYPPFIIEVVGVPAELTIVKKADFFAECVGGFDDLDGSAVAVGDDLDDMQ